MSGHDHFHNARGGTPPERRSSRGVQAAGVPLLRIEDLQVAYRTSKGLAPAVDGVSVTVDRDGVLGIVGESGCGKSTIAYATMGLLDDAVAQVGARRLELTGEDLLLMGRAELNDVRGRRLAMVFQNPGSHLNPVYTIEDQISEVLRVHEQATRGQARTRALSLLEKVGFPDAARHLRSYPHQLSGGMQQRAMIAMALSCSPELLIADEPTTALDVTIQAQIIDLILNLKAELQMGILLITHDMAVIAEMVDSVVVMYAGCIVESGPVQRVLETPRHPYTRGLLASIPALDRRVRHLPSIPGTVPEPGEQRAGCPFVDRCTVVMEQCAVSRPELFSVGDGGHGSACWHDAHTTERK